MARIFVSYRRQDSPYVAAALRDRLERQFGANSVFLDIDNIPFGADFREHIDLAVQQCDVMLVLIGDAWLGVMKGKERNRLFEPRDFVRAEIEAALRRGIPIVPVLVENAETPDAEDLPESIQDLIYRNSAELRAGRDFNSHLTRLVEGVGQMLNSPTKAGATDAQRGFADSPPSVAEMPTDPAPAAPEKDTMKGTHVELQARTGQGASTSETAVLSAPSMPSRQLDTVEYFEQSSAQLQREQNATPAAPALSSNPKPQGIPRVRQMIDESFGNVWGAFQAPHVPEDKVAKAIASYAATAGPREILVLYDSMWRGGKDGFVLTETGVFWRDYLSPAEAVAYRDVTSVERDSLNTILVNGKVIFVPNVVIANALETFLSAIASQNRT